VLRAAPTVGPTLLAASLAAALPLPACAPPAEEPDAGLPDGPTVLWVEPADGATDVAINPIVRVGVSDHLDDRTVSGGAFKLYSGPLSYWMMAYYDPVARRVVAWPSSKLRENAEWVFEAQAGIEARDGGPLAAGRLTGFRTGAATGDDQPFAAAEYLGDIAPIFGSRCASCHGGAAPIAGLALDTAAGVVDTALGIPSDGDAEMDRVTPARPGQSFLIYKIIDDAPVSGDRMPRSFDEDAPAAPLSPDEQQIISDWIAGGAAIGP
jgi:mono/diheme cytochrome c family protein